MFLALSGAPTAPRRGLRLVRGEHRTFTGPADRLRDPVARAGIGAYLTDMARPYGLEVPAAAFGADPSPTLGQSYGEMAAALVGSVVAVAEPVDLLVVAFSVHDLWPGRATATYLSHLCPGTPLSFAICDQGSAGAFSALRVATEYASSAGCQRALLLVVEQAALPYDSSAPLPARHRAVALLYERDTMIDDGVTDETATAIDGAPAARVVSLRQHPDVGVDRVEALVDAELSEVCVDRRGVHIVLSATLAAAWPRHPTRGVTVVPPGQPLTGVWSALVDRLAERDERPDLVVAADYDPGLRYLSMLAVRTD